MIQPDDRADDAADDRVRMAELTDRPLDVAAVHTALAADGSGGICLFVGAVRRSDHGRDVSGLGYSAHPTALGRMRKIAADVAADHDVRALAVVHRVGDLAVGDIAVVCGVATAHRDGAFTACRALIDELKQTVPIWKHQRFTDGTDEWVGTP